jgi:branched-chain amino acid transport system permease protein
MGRSLRAASDNTDAATYLGIDVDKSFTFAFSLGVAITAIGGALLATYYVFQPYIGADYIIIMYAGVVLGGMGRIGGAFFGGMFIAFVQQLSSIVLPMQLQTTSIFVLFILTLLLRPQGFFGRVVDRA